MNPRLALAEMLTLKGGILLLAIALLLAGSLPASAAAEVPQFQLPRRGENQTVTLNDFAGQIVVLDFFAYWCAPCLKSSPVVVREIGRHYATQSGNPAGIPVQVILVNEEPAQAARTDAAIRRADAQFVLDDMDGELMKALGGEQLPFLVILDGSEARQNPNAWRILYHESGFEGAARLRQVIDQVGVMRSTNAPAANSMDALSAEELHWTVESSFDASFEGLWSSDVGLTSSTLQYHGKSGHSDLRVGASLGTYDVDYRHDSLTDPLGVDRHLRDTLIGAQLGYQHRWPDHLTWTLNGGYYQGFTDYRVLWLKEYYRQQYLGVAGYSEPDPQGFNVLGGVRWEYLPTAGFLTLEGGYQRDEVSPGYDFVVDPGPPPSASLQHGSPVLNTAIGRIRLDNVLTRRLRTRLEAQGSDTTDRQFRWSVQGQANLVLAEHWVARTSAGYTREPPELTAWWAGASVEHDWDNRWFLGVTGRYYTDTGYIEDAGLINDATPELQSWRAALEFRWQGKQTAFKLAVGPYFTRYGDSGPGTQPFIHLYQDRNWVQIETAFSVSL